MSEAIPAPRPRLLEWLLLAGCLILYVAARVPWVGHLLMWDEAMIMLSTRTFVSGANDYFSDWFWMHPPLLHLCLACLSPFRAGFAERAELLMIFIGVLNALLLFRLNRRVFGAGAALWSVLFLALCPATTFFDLWIKQDPLVIFFGLLAIYQFLFGRKYRAGICLGLCLLSKELAAYYIAAVGVLWLLQKPRKVGDLAIVFGIAGLCSTWWYLFFSGSIHHILLFMMGKPTFGGAGWLHPWHYFIGKLADDLGAVGLAAALCGAVALWPRTRGGDVAPAWPLALLIPAYIVISVLPGKAPWFTTSLFPALVTLCGLGAAAAQGLVRHAFDRRPAATWIVAAALVVAAGWPRLHMSYEDYLRRQDEGLWWGETASREAAETMNRLVAEGERALITPMYYWVDEDRAPCPVFVYYLKDIPVIVAPHNITSDRLVALVRKYDLDWALVSPEPGGGERELAGPLFQQYRIKPIVLKGAILFETKSLRVRSSTGSE